MFSKPVAQLGIQPAWLLYICVQMQSVIQLVIHANIQSVRY
jgi:hypothetical protein